MGYDPKGLITRRHFLGYRMREDGIYPPPLHVESVHPGANHVPLARPLEAGGEPGPGPALVLGGTGSVSLGIDPTDPATWGGRGYRTCAGMIGRFNGPDDWRGNPEQLNPLGMG
jgi:hypothetical protein